MSSPNEKIGNFLMEMTNNSITTQCRLEKNISSHSNFHKLEKLFPILLRAARIRTSQGHEFCFQPLSAILMLPIKHKLSSTEEMLLFFLRTSVYLSKTNKS